MMKKLSKLAALLAATALLFGAIGCSNDDDDEPKITASDTKIELDADGTESEFTVTFTVSGDTFSDLTKSLSADATIPAENLALIPSDDKVTVSEVKTAAAITDTEAKVSFKLKAAEGAKSGTIKAEIKAGTLTNNSTPSTTFGYTIKGDNPGTGDDDDDTFTSQTLTVDVTEVESSVTAVSDEVTFNPEGIATATVDGTVITIKSEKPGKTTMTIKVSGADYADVPVEIPITVAEDGTITLDDDDDPDITPSGGTSINFDCTDVTTEIGAAIEAVHTAAASAETTMAAGIFDSVTLTGTISHPKTTMYILQLKKNDATASFAVKSGAKISIVACSSGSDKSTYYTVSGAATGSDIVSNATASDLKTLALTATSDGTVTIAVPSKQPDDNTNNNLRIQKITVTY